jgi:diketogulonate reductase-like aldo/keto reductase
MKYVTLFDGTRLPILGLGTWSLGGGMSPDYRHDEEAVRLIRHAIQLGFTHLDTAESYASGHTEELVGRALQGLNRPEVFITTKVSPSNLHYQDVFKALAGSLKRLNTDYVDLYLVHWPNRAIPLEETFQALNELVANGQVRYLGVSNFDLPLLKQAQEYAHTPILTNQVPYSLRVRDYHKNRVLPYCQESGVLLTAYSPIKGSELDDPQVRHIAQKHAVMPAQVALAWLLHQPGVITIPQSSDRQHLAENLQAVDLELDQDDIDHLNRLA